MNQVQELFNLHDRVAIVTGGAGLLGQRHSEALAEAGASIVVADLLADQAQKAAQELQQRFGIPAIGIGTDVTQAASVEAMVKTVKDEFGRIDILINNAAMTVKSGTERVRGYFAPFENYPENLWRTALETGLTGAFLCSQHVGRVMVHQDRGVIVNISSTYGLVGPDQRIYADSKNPYDPELSLNTPAAYAVVKSGIIGLTRYLATYWAGKNIRVNTLTPGGVFDGHDETFVRNYSSRTVLGRMAQPDEYKGALLFLASDASSYMTGANLVVDRGWTAW